MKKYLIFCLILIIIIFGSREAYYFRNKKIIQKEIENINKSIENNKNIIFYLESIKSINKHKNTPRLDLNQHFINISKKSNDREFLGLANSPLNKMFKGTTYSDIEGICLIFGPAEKLLEKWNDFNIENYNEEIEIIEKYSDTKNFKKLLIHLSNQGKENYKFIIESKIKYENLKKDIIHISGEIENHINDCKRFNAPHQIVFQRTVISNSILQYMRYISKNHQYIDVKFWEIVQTQISNDLLINKNQIGPYLWPIAVRILMDGPPTNSLKEGRTEGNGKTL